MIPKINKSLVAINHIFLNKILAQNNNMRLIWIAPLLYMGMEIDNIICPYNNHHEYLNFIVGIIYCK